MDKMKKFAPASRTLLVDPMKKLRTLLSCFLLASVAYTASAQGNPVAEVWKDPSCGCCEDWVHHMEEAGFKVKIHNDGNEEARKKLLVPVKYGSCHTTKIGNYVVEGHVPAADIKRMLKEKPTARGLTAPGMPMGSPGMDGPAFAGQKAAYDVLLIKNDGSTAVYQSYR